jgi:alcohol dehydrogenase class IV
VGVRVVAILLAEQGDPFSLITQYPEGKPAYSPRLMAPKLPIINVPTTGTSAMNRAGSGVRNDDLDHRMEFFDPKTRPVALFWDSEALLTAPVELARSTATTTFSGALMSLANVEANPLVEGDHQQAFRLVQRALPRLLAEPDNPLPRIELCAAAFLQNRAADDAGSGAIGRRNPASATSYALATALHIRYHHVGQGEATASVLPASIRLAEGADPVAMARVAEGLGVPGDASNGAALQGAMADALASYYQSIGVPARVRDLNVPESDIPLLARDTLKNFNANPGLRPDGYVERMEAVLRAAW